LKFLECLNWIDAARDAPVCEFRHIHPPLSRFAIVDHDVTDTELLGELPLCQAGLFAHVPKHCRELAVAMGLQRLEHAQHCRSKRACFSFLNSVKSPRKSAFERWANREGEAMRRFSNCGLFILALALLTVAPSISNGSYISGYTWNRQAVWYGGTGDGTQNGNPNLDSMGNPAWRYTARNGATYGSSW
jgi:hypothetical protein